MSDNTVRFSRRPRGDSNAQPTDSKNLGDSSTLYIQRFYGYTVHDMGVNLSIVSIISMLWCSICTKLHQA